MKTAVLQVTAGAARRGHFIVTRPRPPHRRARLCPPRADSFYSKSTPRDPPFEFFVATNALKISITFPRITIKSSCGGARWPTTRRLSFHRCRDTTMTQATSPE
ncbi:hypothetical protein EVAR_72608_1 [Eumeta japonica]|uniref:Uncharacterized protein n=1 Tax=Eumeta variegata TaxID=151549 RepID=A0A4C1TBV0_EUMVA|nr:hypothetical protein EVAR_72608_1 [Eumeta japonica]